MSAIELDAATAHRPSLAEIEAERARRTFTNERTTHRRKVNRPGGTTTKEN